MPCLWCKIREIGKLIYVLYLHAGELTAFFLVFVLPSKLEECYKRSAGIRKSKKLFCSFLHTSPFIASLFIYAGLCKIEDYYNRIAGTLQFTRVQDFLYKHQVLKSIKYQFKRHIYCAANETD